MILTAGRGEPTDYLHNPSMEGETVRRREHFSSDTTAGMGKHLSNKSGECISECGVHRNLTVRVWRNNLYTIWEEMDAMSIVNVYVTPLLQDPCQEMPGTPTPTTRRMANFDFRPVTVYLTA